MANAMQAAIDDPPSKAPPMSTPDDGGVEAQDDGDADGDAGMDFESNLDPTGPGDWTAGDYPPALREEEYLELSDVRGQRNRTREYKVHVPPGYDPKTPTPLLFCIHGLGQSAVLFCVNGTGMHEKADEEGFILVMPNGYQNSWNGGVCCGAAASDRLDDVAFFRAIFAELSDHLNIDRNRVYATGHSSGAFMSYRLACEAADLFTAIAPSAGLIGINGVLNRNLAADLFAVIAPTAGLFGLDSVFSGTTIPNSDFEECRPSRPVPVLDIHGEDDPLVPFSAKRGTLELLQKRYDCDSEPVPARAPESRRDTTCVSYEGCSNDTEVTACVVEDGGNCWFGSGNCGTGAGLVGQAFAGRDSEYLRNTVAVWEFFERVSASP